MTTVMILVAKLRIGVAKYPVRSIVLAGGVSANDHLREEVACLATELGIPSYAPVERLYSMDNAAMVGIYAYYAT